MKKISTYFFFLVGFFLLIPGCEEDSFIEEPISTDISKITAKGNQGKITICHMVNSQNFNYVLIEINQNALGAHLAHGDMVPETFYLDGDEDGFGDPDNSETNCEQPDGFVLNNDDCNDDDPSVNPTAAEICGDGIDNNCNNIIDENCSGNGKTLDFDGTSDYVLLPGTWGGPSWTELTIEAWIYQDAVDNTFHAILSSNNSNQWIHFQVGPANGNIVAYGSPSGVLLPTIPPLAGVWRHVAVVIKSGNSRLYIDGVQIGASASTFNFINSSGVVTIGRGFANTRFFDGKIDDLRIWDIGRTQGEIQSDMNNELIGNEANLRAYYNFNQGVCGGLNPGVTILNDLAGGDDNGTLQTFALNGCNSNWVCSASCGFANNGL